MDNCKANGFYNQIRHADSAGTLYSLRAEASDMLRNPGEESDPLEYNKLVNGLHDALIRRVVVLAEQEMSNRGYGLPPVSYSFMLAGSGGRKEQTLWSDQDNAVVYADPPDSLATAADAYFSEFAAVLVRLLERIGYPPCEGNVICTNPMWRHPLSGWLTMVRGWLAEPSWENMRYTLIAADLRALTGDGSLTAAIRRQLLELLRVQPQLLKHLLENTLHRKVALGLFGQLITERYGEAAGGVDLKYGSYIPFVNAVRLLAIQAGVDATATCGRLRELTQIGFMTVELHDDWADAFALNLKLRSMTAHTLNNGIFATTGKLTAEQLTANVKRELKVCLHAGERLQKYVKMNVEKK